MSFYLYTTTQFLLHSEDSTTLNKLIHSEVKIFSRVEAYLTPDQQLFLDLLIIRLVLRSNLGALPVTFRVDVFEWGLRAAGCVCTFSCGEGHAPVVLLQRWYCLFLGLNLQLAAVLQNKLLLVGAVW